MPDVTATIIAMVCTGLVFAFGAICHALAISPARTGRVPLATRRRRIAGLDLGPVREKAAKRHQWPKEKALELEAEYRDFLMLVAANMGKSISPWSDDLDLFWHEHILDTQRYAEDCTWIFGGIVQHDPHIDKHPYHHEQTRRVTMQLRAAQLEARKGSGAERPNPAPVKGNDDVQLIMVSCSAGPVPMIITPDAHSSSGDGHSGGHSCGGHSGGHSCGGHSGGHSCGGHSGGHSCGGHSCGGHSCGGSSCGSSCGSGH